jgi:hypothetical protein
VTPRDRDEEPPDEALPTSLVPRWLAGVVLIALLASAGFSVCSLLSERGGPGSTARPPREAPAVP